MDDQNNRTPDRGSSHGWSTARRRLAELLIVFVGVYAAFLLNRFDSDRRDARRRTQILDSLEQEVRENVDELRTELDEGGKIIADFDHKLAAGEMPPLYIVFTNTGYSASDDATILQAGGLELLDVQTLQLLRQVNGLHRSLEAVAHDKAEISLVELANHDPGDFYDPGTHQLLRRYAWYPLLQHSLLAAGRSLLEAEEKLLANLESERHPGEPPPSPAPARGGQTTPPRSPAASSPAT